MAKTLQYAERARRSPARAGNTPGAHRKGAPGPAWLQPATATATATWKRTQYDVDGAAAAIRAARLPDSLAERLEYGQ